MMKLTTLALAALPTLATAAPHDAEIASVRALYARYAAEAAIDDRQPPTLATATGAVLRQHFTAELTRLWLRDRDCVKRTREICRIDFLPLWDSQDPTGTFVRLDWDAAKGRVAATLRRADGSTRTLGYSMALVNGRWRIADIAYGSGRANLRQLLAADPSPR